MQYFCVTGSPRSGTTAFGQLLNTHANICCLHEYDLAELLTAVDSIFNVERVRKQNESNLNPAARLKRSSFEELVIPVEQTSSGANGTVDKYLIPRKDRDFLRVLDSVMCATSGKSELLAVGDKTPNKTDPDYFSALESQLPGLKIVFVLRNPVDVVRSSLARSAATKLGDDNWHITSIEDAVQEWVKNWESAVHHRRSLSDNHLYIKYESLRDNFSTEAERIADFFTVTNSFTNIMTPDGLRNRQFQLSSAQTKYIYDRIGSLVDEWSELSIEELLDNHRSVPFSVGSGQAIHSEDKTLANVVREGFYNVEDWGVWTKDSNARIVFKLADAASVEDVWIDFSYGGYVGDANDFVFGLRVNGGPLDMVHASAQQASGFTANFGKLYSVKDGAIEIKLSMPRRKTPQQLPIEEWRTIGLALRSIRATIL